VSYIGEASVEMLLQDLSCPAWEIRRDAADLLGERGDRRVVPHLIAALKDPVGAVRSAVAQALGKIGGEDVLEPLLKCLDDEKFGNPGPVLEALGTMNLRSKQAVPYLIRFLRDADARTRGIANTSLMVITGQSKGFRAQADDESRERACQKWEMWWRENQQTFVVPGSKLT
jgi:HEAT repeat protein